MNYKDNLVSALELYLGDVLNEFESKFSQKVTRSARLEAKLKTGHFPSIVARVFSQEPGTFTERAALDCMFQVRVDGKNTIVIDLEVQDRVSKDNDLVSRPVTTLERQPTILAQNLVQHIVKYL